MTTTTTDGRIERIDRALDDATEKLKELARDREPNAELVHVESEPIPEAPPPPIVNVGAGAQVLIQRADVVNIHIPPETRKQLCQLFPGLDAMLPAAPALPPTPQPAAPPEPVAHKPVVAAGNLDGLLVFGARNRPAPVVAVTGNPAAKSSEQFGLPWSTLKKQLIVVGSALAAGFGAAAVAAQRASAEAGALPFELTSRGAHDYLEAVPDGPEREERAAIVQEALDTLPADEANAIVEGATEAAIESRVDKLAVQTATAIAAVDEKATLAGAIATEAHETAAHALGLGVENAGRIADVAIEGQRQATATMDALTQVRREAHDRDMATQARQLDAERRTDERVAAVESSAADDRAVTRRELRDARKSAERDRREMQRERPAPAAKARKSVEKSSASTGDALRAHLKKTEHE